MLWAGVFHLSFDRGWNGVKYLRWMGYFEKHGTEINRRKENTVNAL